VEPEDIEANRIAGELRELADAGALKGTDDPEAAFYACLIRDFGATFVPEENHPVAHSQRSHHLDGTLWC
jgi:hypothetical protein